MELKIPGNRKMTFPEFVAYQDSDENNIDDNWLEHWKRTIPKMLSSEKTREHDGDCTNTPSPCTLCTLEQLLSEYREYFFEEEESKVE